MSQGMPNNSDLVKFRVVNEEEYRANVKRAEEAQAQLDHFKAMNEAAKKAHDQQQELLRKIQEGKEAERQLQALADSSGTRPLATASSSGQTNPPIAQPWNPASNAYRQQVVVYETNYQTIQAANQHSGSSYSQQNGDAVKYVHYQPAWQPETLDPVHSQNYVQPQQNTALRHSLTTSRHPARQQVPVQQGRQALSMQPVVPTLQPNQVKAAPPSVPASISTSVQQQNFPHTQSYQGPSAPNFTTYSRVQQHRTPPTSGFSSGALDASEPAVPNFVTSSRVQQYPASPLSGSSYGPSEALKMTEASQPSSSTVISLPKVAKLDEVEVGDTATNVQVQIVNRTPSRFNSVSVPPSTGGSSQGTDQRVDIALWQRFSQSVVSWASSAAPSSQMPLINTKIKVVKDAKSQVFILTPGADGHTPITMTLQALLASLLVNGEKTSTPEQVAAEPPTDPGASDSWNRYRPPRHQALQASVSSGTSNMLTNDPKNMSPARMAHSTPTKSSAVLTSSERTPSQANKKTIAKDILRALGFSSMKRSHPDDPSELQAFEPPVKRHAPSQTSDAGDVLLQASIKNVERSLQNADTHPPQAATSDQATSTPADPEAPVSSAILSESVSLQSSNSHLIAAPNISQPHTSSTETTYIASKSQVPQSLSLSNDDTRSVTENLLIERPTTPLFLPSMSSSPIAGPSNENSMDPNRQAVRHAKRSTQLFYIIVPPDPFWLKQYKVQQLRKKGRRESERELSSGWISSDKETSLGRHRKDEGDEIEDEDNDVIDLDPANNLATDGFEREAILLSCSRIMEQPCKWNSCNVVLNSAEKLIRHLAFAHQELFEACKNTLPWQHCRHSAVNWAKLFRHLKGHVLIPLRCAYQDCKESFRNPRRLVKHHQTVHRNDPPKPSDTPFSPILKAPPPTSPLVLPSYLMEPVQRPSMSKERHGSLGPWVLRQIAGPVNHEVKRYNAASKLLQSPSRSYHQDYQPYDFLSFPSTNHSSAPSLPSKIRGMEDLHSGEVSDMVHNGLVLWGPQQEDEDKDEDELLLLSSPLLQTSSHEKATTEEQLEVNAVQMMLEN